MNKPKKNLSGAQHHSQFTLGTPRSCWQRAALAAPEYCSSSSSGVQRAWRPARPPTAAATSWPRRPCRGRRLRGSCPNNGSSWWTPATRPLNECWKSPARRSRRGSERGDNCYVSRWVIGVAIQSTSGTASEMASEVQNQYFPKRDILVLPKVATAWTILIQSASETTSKTTSQKFWFPYMASEMTSELGRSSGTRLNRHQSGSPSTLHSAFWGNALSFFCRMPKIFAHCSSSSSFLEFGPIWTSVVGWSEPQSGSCFSCVHAVWAIRDKLHTKQQNFVETCGTLDISFPKSVGQSENL